MDIPAELEFLGPTIYKNFPYTVTVPENFRGSLSTLSKWVDDHGSGNGTFNRVIRHAAEGAKKRDYDSIIDAVERINNQVDRSGKITELLVLLESITIPERFESKGESTGPQAMGIRTKSLLIDIPDTEQTHDVNYTKFLLNEIRDNAERMGGVDFHDVRPDGDRKIITIVTHAHKTAAKFVNNIIGPRTWHLRIPSIEQNGMDTGAVMSYMRSKYGFRDNIDPGGANVDHDLIVETGTRIEAAALVPFLAHEFNGLEDVTMKIDIAKSIIQVDKPEMGFLCDEHITVDV